MAEKTAADAQVRREMLAALGADMMKMQDEVERLRAIVASAAGAMQAMHPDGEMGEMTAAEFASMWNATQGMLDRG